MNIFQQKNDDSKIFEKLKIDLPEQRPIQKPKTSQKPKIMEVAPEKETRVKSRRKGKKNKK